MNSKRGRAYRSEAKAAEAEFFGRFPLVTRCFCGWSFEGTAAEGRIAAQEHRRKCHRELPVKTPKLHKRSKRRWDGGWDE